MLFFKSSCRGRIPHMDKCRVYYIEENPKSAIVIVNDKIEGLFIRELSSEHHTCVKIMIDDTEVYMINSYFQYKDDINVHLQAWEICVKKLKRKRILLAGDVNAKSILWYNEDTDTKGEELEAFIEANYLEICDKEGEKKTFAGIPGSTTGEVNIHVTLVTRNVNIENWIVQDEGNSDYNIHTCRGTSQK